MFVKTCHRKERGEYNQREGRMLMESFFRLRQSSFDQRTTTVKRRALMELMNDEGLTIYQDKVQLQGVFRIK